MAEGDTVVMSPSLRYPRQWDVNACTAVMFEIHDLIGSYRAIHPFALDGFLDALDALGLEPVFTSDPVETLEWIESLTEPPGVTLLGEHLPDTTDGFRPFQIRALNFMKTARAGLLEAAMGTGKTCVAAGLAKWHLDRDNFDTYLFVCKSNALVATWETLRDRFGIDAHLLDGSQPAHKRLETWERADHPGTVIVANYEAVANDLEHVKPLVQDRRLFIVLDESSNKLKNHESARYQRFVELLYVTNERVKGKRQYVARKGCERAREMFALCTTGTPIENAPDELWAQVNLIAPEIYGPHTTFVAEFANGIGQFDRPRWDPEKLPLMGARIAHITFQVSKDDPEIASQFPRKDPQEIEVALHPIDQQIYDALQDEYRAMNAEEISMLGRQEILGAINVLQMLCVDASMVLDSATDYLDYCETREAFEDTLSANPRTAMAQLAEFDRRNRRGSEVAVKLLLKVGVDVFDGAGERSSKMIALRQELETHDKSVVFTAYNSLFIPRLSGYLNDWGFKHVVLAGGMSPKKRAEAVNHFREDPSIRVFLSSNAGADSINLEAASQNIQLDYPWNPATKDQRADRNDRIISQHEVIQPKDIWVKGTVEDRRRQILAKKRSYSKGVFGRSVIAEQSLDSNDLMYVLMGSDD